MIYPDGTTEETHYDRLDVDKSKNRMNQWTQFVHAPTGELLAVVNPAGETTQYDWCRCGALSRIVDPEGRITALTMTLAGI